MLADLGENLSIIHFDHNIFSISYVDVKARRDEGNEDG